MSWRPAATRVLPAVPVVVALAVIAAVRPGVLTSAVGSPVAWAVSVGVLLAGLGARALVTRAGGSRALAGSASTVMVLALLAVLVAPSFRDRTLVEDFPSVPAAALATPAVPTEPDGPLEADAGSSAPTDAPTTPAPPPSAAPAPAPQGPVLGASGGLEGIDHRASGVLALYALDGTGVLRFEDVVIEGTVDPSVHLVPRGTRTPGTGLVLGALKAERGSFSYELPADVDLNGDWTVLVWCDPFNTPIAAADLTLA